MLSALVPFTVEQRLMFNYPHEIISRFAGVPYRGYATNRKTRA